MIRLFQVFVPVGTLTLLVSEALLVSSALLLATFLALEVDPSVFLLYDGGLPRIAVVLVSILTGLYLSDLYSQYFVKSRILLLQQLCLVMGAAFLFQAFISYLNPNFRVPIRVMVTGSAFAIAAIYIWRLLFSAFAIQVVGRDRLLLVGGSPLLEDIARHVEQRPEIGLAVVGYVDDAHEIGTMLPGGKALGPLAAFREIVTAVKPNRIVVGMYERRNRVPVPELLELRFAGHIIEEAATAYERVCGRVCLKELRPAQLIYSGELGPHPQDVAHQRILDSALAAMGLLVFWPFMLLTALAVRLSSPGPVLYRQTRVGLNGREFTLYKFRSMRADAEAGTGAVWASKHDPRVTVVGQLIRRIRFDELPQLLNVIRGEMAIVGPRPERPEFVRELSEQIAYYRQRHCVRPGITGWAQINHKYGDTLEDTISKLEYDLYYIKNMSLGLDTYIILQTLKTMLLSRGAQ
ncbi:MAG: sugar transferase [Acidobacteriia bacterium]|nr:sugar transferase [Terriglobia bacterium]